MKTQLMDLRREAECFRVKWNAASDVGRQALLDTQSQRERWKRIHAAQQAFGDLNGWTLAEYFTPNEMGSQDKPKLPSIRDHVIYSEGCFCWDEKWNWTGYSIKYREVGPDGRNIAIVGQPFNAQFWEPYKTLTLEQYRENLDACAKQCGLR
jgi:hypothetical protein